MVRGGGVILAKNQNEKVRELAQRQKQAHSKPFPCGALWIHGILIITLRKKKTGNCQYHWIRCAIQI